jgi:uncharacterized membrane protein HdeD (DUF308 family)
LASHNRANAVKVKTALTQSKVHARFLGVMLVVLLVLLVCFPSGALAVLTALVALPFACEVINIIYIRRKSRKNPDYLEEKIQ